MSECEALAAASAVFMGFGAWHKHRYIVGSYTGFCAFSFSRYLPAMASELSVFDVAALKSRVDELRRFL